MCEYHIYLQVLLSLILYIVIKWLAYYNFLFSYSVFVIGPTQIMCILMIYSQALFLNQKYRLN